MLTVVSLVVYSLFMDVLCLFRSSVPADQRQAAALGEAAGESAGGAGHLEANEVQVPFPPSYLYFPWRILMMVSVSVWTALHSCHRYLLHAYPGGSVVKNLPAKAGDTGLILGEGNPLEREMATYSSILAWQIPLTEEPGGLESMGSQRVRHHLATKTTITVIHSTLALSRFC